MHSHLVEDMSGEPIDVELENAADAAELAELETLEVDFNIVEVDMQFADVEDVFDFGGLLDN